MKALFVGAGSIGKRHIKDFYRECREHGVVPEISVLRRKKGDLGETEKYISRQIIELDNEEYDAAFITNPTTLHYEAILACAGKVKYFFVEKPIFESTDYLTDSLGINACNTYVAAPMRHTKLYSALKEIVNENSVYAARVICSSYLPEWRPNIDYRMNYSAIRELGGGVQLDLIHEMDYIYDLFGEPEESYCLAGKYSDLEITSDDISIYILRYQKLLCEVHLDYFGSKYTRKCELYTKKGNYVIDFHDETVTFPDGTVIDHHVMNDEEYINEMRYFYRFISGEVESINPPEKAMTVLRLSTERKK